MSELPKSWAAAPIRALMQPLSDGKLVHQGWSPQCESGPARSDCDWGGLKTTAIQDGAYLPEHNKRLPDSLDPKERLEVQAGDLLMTCAGPRVRCGVACLVRETPARRFISGKMYRFRANDQLIDSRLLEAFLRTPETKNQIDAMKTGISESGMNITHERFSQLVVPVAPRSEQKRIADKLDTVLTRVDAVNTRLARVAPILKRFRQSVLAAATSGRLTEDWRISQGLKYGAETTLQAICIPDRVITYGVVKLGDETPGGTPCLRTSNVRWLRFELEGMKLINPNLSAEYGRTVLRGGEVLVNVRGTLGGVAVATDDMSGWNVSREVAVVPVDQALASSVYISLWIASDECQRWLTGVAKGVAYTGINIEDLRKLPLRLPLMEEQFEVVRRVEALFAFADRLEARLQAAHTASERLTPALLAKAFRGELVPQDPNDEPASELLRRLQQEAPSTSAKRGRKSAA